MKVIFLVGLLISINLVSFSQGRAITGYILDKESQTPIKNAHIIIYGTTSGTISKDNGSFELFLKKKRKQIVVSHIGYGTRTINALENSLSIELNKSLAQLPIINIGQGEYSGPSNYIEFNEEKYNSTLTKNLSSEDGNIAAEINANFYEGFDNLYAFFALNFQYPTQVLETNIKGRIFLQFTIAADGSVVNPKVHGEDESTGIKDEIQRVLTKMPKWYPAIQQGIQVEQGFIVPIAFAANQ